MPKVTTQTARNDVYAYGVKVPTDKTKSGFRIDRSKPQDDNDRIIIPKGSKYYMWSFPFGPTVRQLTPPRRSQLTMSEFLSTFYDMQDRVSSYEATSLEELSEEIEDLKSEIETLRDEQEEKRSNMPESLQDAPSGELLQERYDALEEWYNELDCIDCDSEIGEFEEWTEDEGMDEEEFYEAHETREDYDQRVQEELDEKLQEYVTAMENCQAG